MLELSKHKTIYCLEKYLLTNYNRHSLNLPTIICARSSLVTNAFPVEKKSSFYAHAIVFIISLRLKSRVNIDSIANKLLEK